MSHQSCKLTDEAGGEEVRRNDKLSDEEGGEKTITEHTIRIMRLPLLEKNPN